MKKWQNLLKTNTLYWLLEENNLSVRYFRLVDIPGSSETDFKVIMARKNIIQSRVVTRIFGKQNEEGYCEEPEKFYTAKYKGTVWQLLILAELGASGKDKRIKKACEFILKNSQYNESEGFSYRHSARADLVI